jgi:hypothetical protein
MSHPCQFTGTYAHRYDATNMADGLGSLAFAELHLLPRVIFAVGAAVFATSLFHPNPILASLGLGFVFIALAYNFFYSFIINIDRKAPDDNPKGFHREREALILHGVVSLILSGYCFYALYAALSTGAMPIPFRFLI